MRIKNHFLGLLIAALSTGQSHSAIVVANSVTTSTTASSGSSVNNIINGSGGGSGAGALTGALTEANKFTVGSNTAYGAFSSTNMYLTNQANNGTFTFSFTGGATIAQILIWNYSQTAARGLDSISNVEVNTGGGFTSILTSFGLVPAGDANFQAQVIDLPTALSGVTQIRLTTTQAATGGGEFAGGFDEVAFSTVPEPSAILLGGLGLLGFLRRRR